jgi:GNAT superfamily N-acetyltransferase
MALFPHGPMKQATERICYSWKLAENPQGHGEMVLAMSDGMVVGSATLTPRLICCQGRYLDGAEIGDTYTHPDFRRRGVFTMCVEECQRIAQERGFRVVYGGPNDQSLRGYVTKLDFALAQSARVQALQKRYSSADEMDSARSHWKSELIANVERAEVALLGLNGRVRGLGRGAAAGVIDLSGADLPQDIFIADPNADFSTVASGAYLKWRYVANPEHYRFHGIELRGEIRGVLVTKLIQTPQQAVLVVMDFFANTVDPETASVVASAVDDLAKRERVDFCELYAVQNSPYYRAFRRCGFLWRENKPVIVFTGTQEGRSLAGSRLRWHFTVGDTDHR